MPSVQSCTLAREGHSAEFDERNRGHYTLVYVVVTDGVMAGNTVATEALQASPHALPSLWASFSYQGGSDPYSFAQRFRVTPRFEGESLKHYIIEVSYAPLEPGEPPDVGEVNPLQRTAWVEWDSEVFTKNVTEDKDGNPILNKCKRRFDDVVPLEQSRGVLIVNFPVANLAEVIALQEEFELKANSTSFSFGGRTFGPRRALCREVKSQPRQIENGTEWFEVRMRIALKRPGEKWDERLLEQGYEHWKKEGGDYIEDDEGNNRMFDGSETEKGVPYAEPVLLASDGTKLADDGTAIFTDWEVIEEADFNDMPWV